MKNIVINKKTNSLFLKMDLNKEIDEEKIKNVKLEKRKRFQVYTTLDYLISMNSYFDFFSLDTLKIFQAANYITKIESKRSIDSKSLLLSFLTDINPNKNLYESYDLNISNIIIEKNMPDSLKKSKRIIFDFLFKFSFLNFFEELNLAIDNLITILFSFTGIDNSYYMVPKYSDLIRYTLDMKELFEFASENAIDRFKTPVITPEILFITLMEKEIHKASKIIKNIIHDETNFYLLRYKLLKKLHAQESFIKYDVKKNYLYFTYLLKTQLSEFEFNRLMDYNSLGILLFRNLLVYQITQLDTSKYLKTDIYTSIKYNRRERRYYYKFKKL